MNAIFSWGAASIGAIVVMTILATPLIEPAKGPGAVSAQLAWAIKQGATPLLFAGAWMIYGLMQLRLDGALLIALGAVCTVWGWAMSVMPKGLALGLATMAVGSGLMMAGDVLRRAGPKP